MADTASFDGKCHSAPAYLRARYGINSYLWFAKMSKSISAQALSVMAQFKGITLYGICKQKLFYRRKLVACRGIFYLITKRFNLRAQAVRAGIVLCLSGGKALLGKLLYLVGSLLL